MSEELSRVEDLLENGVEEPVLPMSELEAILRGEKIKPHSRVAELLLQYNPQDILIEKRIDENGTYYASVDNADGYFKVIVDTPVVPPTVLDHLVETITDNGEYTYTPEHDGYSDATITVNVPSVQPVVASKTITANGTYVAADEQLDGYSQAVVNVPPTPLDTMNITHNGTYHPPTGRGFDEVNVAIPLGTKTITENGTYTATDDNLDGYSSVDVDVPQIGIKDIPNTPTSIATFTDGTSNPLKSLTASIVPVQTGSGDPSPSNVRPISGWTGCEVNVSGVNVWDEETELGSYYNTTGEKQDSTTLTRSKNPIKVIPSSTCYLNIGSTRALNILQYDENMNYLGSSTLIQNTTSRAFTVTENTCYITFYFLGTTYNNDISINYPSTDTEYHAYSGTTTTIPFTDSQGQSVTVYGGSVDVVNGGEQPRTMAMVDMGDINWSYTNNRFYYNPTNAKVYEQTEIANLLCSIYRTSKYLSQADNSISSYYGYIYVKADSYGGDITAFKTAMAGQKIVYELATPTTFYTQPTSIKSLDGDNNVFASTGKILSGQYFGYVYPELGTKTITENGTYDPADDSLDGYSGVTVTIPLGTKTITENGTYTATDDNLDGYSQVTINVAGGGGKFPIYDFHENEDGTIVVRRKVYIVNGKMKIETKWFFNGYHMSAFLTDIPSNLLPFARPNTDVSGESYSDDTSATQNGWVAISTAYYQNKLVCYTTGWSSDSNKDVWAVIDVDGGTQQTFEWSDPYENVGETKYYTYYRALDGQIIVRVEYPDAERTYAKQTLWFFNGYYTDGTDKDIPSILIPYLPKNWSTDVMMTSGYTDDTSSTQLGWVGFLYPNQTPPSTKIRTWNTGKGGLQSGSFWGVLDISGQEEQITEWFDPYENVPPRQIKNYGGTIEDGYNLNTELKTLGNVYHDSAMSYEIDNDSFDITWNESGAYIGFSFNGDVDLKASDIQRLSYKIDFGNCYDAANNQNIRPFVIGVTDTIRTTPSTGIYFNPSQVDQYFTKYKMYYKDVCNTTVEDYVDISDIEGPCYLFIVATGWIASITDLSMVSNSTPQIGTTLSQFNFFNYMSEDSRANKINPIDTESFDVYWSGAVYIGHCLTGNIPLSGKKRLDIDMDYIGENYQHSSGTHTRNHNLAIVVTDIKVDSYVNLDNLERDNHIIAIKEWDGNDIYGQSIHTSIDLSNISGEYYINYQLPGFNINGFKARLYSTNAILPQPTKPNLVKGKIAQESPQAYVGEVPLDIPLAIGRWYVLSVQDLDGRYYAQQTASCCFQFQNEGQTISIPLASSAGPGEIAGRLVLKSNSINLTNYPDNWRDIYAKITPLPDSYQFVD